MMANWRRPFFVHKDAAGHAPILHASIRIGRRGGIVVPAMQKFAGARVPERGAMPVAGGERSSVVRQCYALDRRVYFRKAKGDLASLDIPAQYIARDVGRVERFAV